LTGASTAREAGFADGRLVDMELLRKLFGLRAESISLAPPLADACVFCGMQIVPGLNKLKCTRCGSTPRLRSMTALFPRALGTGRAPAEGRPRTLLAFSAVKAERDLLSPYFAKVVSVSLYGRYGVEHTEGIDGRDLSRYADASFDGHFSCGALFDYFIEHKQALAEAYRVLADDGVFLTHILHTRLKEGDAMPTQRSVIQPRPGHYQYVPDHQPMSKVQVGASWFLRTMTEVGFRATRFRIGDPSGIVCDWFVGDKVRAASGIGLRPAARDRPAQFRLF
jgi:hypothetical protein